jgi:hypothetical protein
MTQKIATAADLFSAPPKRRFDVVGPLPVSGHTVRIRSLTSLELSRYQCATIATAGAGLKKSRMEDASERLIALCLVDDEGNPICTPEHVARMAEWDSADVEYLYERCARWVGVKKGEIEDLVKNSEGIGDAASP